MARTSDGECVGQSVSPTLQEAIATQLLSYVTARTASVSVPIITQSVRRSFAVPRNTLGLAITSLTVP